jgi:endonuclease/exonuclease/phosphatase family metal-dependent hydrolase
LTWNVQGSAGVDVDAVARHIRTQSPDVVALQEVQRRQAARLAGALAMPNRRWALKHWPVIRRAEGLAVLTPHRIVGVDAFRIRGGPIWSWRRRIGIDVTIDTGAVIVRLLDVHLSPHDVEESRRVEARLLIDRAGRQVPTPLVVGDLNDEPRQGAHAELVGAGWIDAWQRAHGDAGGATNWSSGDRQGRPPTQRLDFVLAPSGSVVEDATVLDDPLELLGALSDHLPLVATVRLPEAGRTGR